MSRRTLALVLGLAVAASVAVYAFARGGGSGPATPTAAAGPATQKPERRSVTGARPGPSLESANPSTESAAPGEETQMQRPHIAPELQARVAALAGSKAPAPTGTA